MKTLRATLYALLLLSAACTMGTCGDYFDELDETWTELNE